MSIATTIAQVRERATTQWLARTEQERRLLAIGGAVVLLAIVYLLLVDPAVEGRARLNRSLPQLRQQAAELQAMAQEANALARAPATQVAPLSREAIDASLNGRGLKPQSLSATGEFIKVQFNDVPFAALATWLDEQRRANRVQVQDAAITSLPAAGQVDASLTLRQNTGAAQ
ncbi:type II secretion system protein M [Massilia sp. YIM B02763]|uniref:type II secretion system protein M n=1 Tax=Massilia sp. YIM B02763 TaxID=3050130 RepID=UPI0025B6B93A|nr:type II secretion system protein M [Massilia sp. YIM B02763]MDN4053667.1 type II secretion system protein M [Massilia sp. YIM B02763]